MGLDISTFKLSDVDDGDVKTLDYFTLTEKDKELFEKAGMSEYVFKRTEEFIDIEKYLTTVAVPGSNIDDWEWRMSYPSEYEDDRFFKFIYSPSQRRYEVRASLCDTYTKELDVIYQGDDVGYQRKGMNVKFYQDFENGIANYFVVSKKELERYRDEYVDEAYIEHFQEEIINPFIEGEMVAIFDW